MTRVLIAGSGVAAVESALALHALGRGRFDLELLAPAAELRQRPWSVLTPFGADPAPRIDLGDLVAELDMRWHRDALAAADREAHVLLTRDGGRLPYDIAIIATGARSADAIPGAVTFRGPLRSGAVEVEIARAAHEPGLRLVFAVPAATRWTLPLYELALLAAARLPDPDIAVVTPERRPLEVLGGPAADAAAAALDRSGIEVLTGATPTAAHEGALRLDDGRLVSAAAVIALPELVGPRIAGLPHDAAGFIPVDGHGRVQGCEDVYAAGDATVSAVKHGGLAAQQADAIADAIAGAGAPVSPVVRALLLTGDAPIFIHADLASGRTVTSTEPLWWPADKIAGRYLSPYLAAGTATGATLEDRSGAAAR